MNRRVAFSMLCAAPFAVALQAHAAPAETAPARRAWFTLNPSTVVVKMTMPPGIPKEIVDKLPGLNGAPKRSMNISLSSPQLVRETAKAEVDVPEGLQVGKTLPLALENLQLPKKDDQQFKMSYYFGCAVTAPAGQPVTYTLDSWQKLAGDTRGSYGIPVQTKLNELPKEVSAKGVYTLRSYAGNVSVTIPAEMDFMTPLEVLSPKLEDRVDTSKSLTVSWNKVPRAKAYMVTAFGLKAGADSVEGGVMWWSAGDPKFAVHGMMGRTPSGVDVAQADRLKRGWYLGPEATKCSIPAGIFSPGDPFTVTVTAFGEEKVITQRYDEATKTNVPMVPAISITPQSTTTLTLNMPDISGPIHEGGRVPDAPTPDTVPQGENVPQEPPVPDETPEIPEN